MILAITGGTGFVGSHLLEAALAAGHRVRALTRRAQPARPRVEWVDGTLHDSEALRQLVEGADALIHVAGVINAPDEAAFEAGNVKGTLAIVAAATAGGVRRLVHVSSLAAREPGLSMYGRSKARSEELVTSSGLDWVIVRPPAVYGPGDRETLELFAMAKRGLVLLPPRGRFSLIHVSDLAQLLLALARRGAPARTVIEPDDRRDGGWSHREFAAALGQAVGRKGLSLSAPRALMRIAALADRLIRRDRAKLTLDRVAYFCHPDWVAEPDRRPPPDLWQAAIDTPAGLAETAAWYRQQGWL